MVRNKAKAATVFPVVSGYNIQAARVEDLIIDGNKESNIHLNGCRGAGIFLYRAFGTVIQSCVVRNYNGDGISFQQSNDVSVFDCVSEDNAFLGIHPGSGSQSASVSPAVTELTVCFCAGVYGTGCLKIMSWKATVDSASPSDTKIPTICFVATLSV
jgi:hypothetical protein